MHEVVLQAQDIKTHFAQYKGLFFRKQTSLVRAVDGVSLNLLKGKTLGLVGESGCGKSTLGRTLIRLYNPNSGKITLCEHDITKIEGQDLQKRRRDIQMIFQDPYASLNPRMTVFDIIAEPLRSFKVHQDQQALEINISQLMEKVGLSSRFVRKYPHEFSGGQRQRIAIARAIAVRPKVIICDEPVSALDVSIQAQILNLLKDLQEEFELSYIFIAHDISAVRHISDQIAVMYLGKIVEQAPSESLFRDPKHPYTKALLSAVPIADPKLERDRQQIVIEGDLPSPLNPPKGCHFHTRCPWKKEICSSVYPEEKVFDDGVQASCHLLVS